MNGERQTLNARPNRREFISLWSSLPRVASVSYEEVMTLLENQMLWGPGLGRIDIHLLASTLIPETYSGPWTVFCGRPLTNS